MSLVAELQEKLLQKRAEAMQLFQMAETSQIDPKTGAKLLDANKITPGEVQKREAELADLEEQYQVARMAAFKEDNETKWKEAHEPDYKYVRPGRAGFVNNPNIKADGTPHTLTDLIWNSSEFKGRDSNPKRHMTLMLDDYEMKTLLVSANLQPAYERDPVPVNWAVRPLRMADLIPSTDTTAQVIEYMEQTAFGDAATTVSETGVKPETTIQWTPRTAKIEKIAVWVPVSEEALDDVAQMRVLIEQDLRMEVMREEEDQILTGNNTSPNIKGFLSVAMALQSQNRGSDTNEDAIYKAFTLIRWTGGGYAEPTAVVLHPTNWEPMRLRKTTTNEYIWGHPAVVGPETLWGKPVVITDAITVGTALTGDFAQWSRIYRRMGVRIDISDSHDVFFIANKLAIRAEERMTLIVRRPKAFAKIINLN